MKLKAMHRQLCRVVLIMFALALLVAVEADHQALSSAAAQTLPGCNYSTCGDVEIPYPFGIGMSSDEQPCFLDARFSLTCVNDSKLYWVNVQVFHISLEGQMDTFFPVSWYCESNNTGIRQGVYIPSFSISRKENKFITVGCNGKGTLMSFRNSESYSIGCSITCPDNTKEIDDGMCSGIGCCQMDIPPKMRNITIRASSALPADDPAESCTYTFVVKQGSYNFSTTHLQHFPYEELPLVIDWTVGMQNCSAAESEVDYACSHNSYCDDKDRDIFGYRCRCKPGYEGNPYHPDGCIDIDECKTSHTCMDEFHCLNTNGSYKCFCPHGNLGDGTKAGGCHPLVDVRTKVVIGVFAGLGPVILLLGLWWLHKVIRRKMVKKRKEKFFKLNGGMLLEQKLSSGEVSFDKAKVFSLKDLEKATDHFNMNRVLGKGGQGTVYKGMLTNGQIVAVKKFKVQGNVEEFINEFVILSQINHRNVVKLLGCCLETEIPLLVYEFIQNGNLYEYLHEQSDDLPMT